MTGHCSKCHKVWTLEAKQGLCPLCGKRASCSIATKALRSIKSSRRRKQRQSYQDNGYDQLEQAWLSYYQVASKFAHKAQPDDREDLLHDILIALAVAEGNKDKPFTEALMYRIASYTVADYWRDYYQAHRGLDCRHCSKARRDKCKEDWLYTECPKAIRLESLSKPIFDGEGNYTELGDLIADDKAIDLEAWLDCKTWLLGHPKRLIEVARKRVNGEPLDNSDKCYLQRFRQQEQKCLF